MFEYSPNYYMFLLMGRTEAEMAAQGRFTLRVAATELGVFKDEPSKIAFMCMPNEQQVAYLKPLLEQRSKHKDVPLEVKIRVASRRFTDELISIRNQQTLALIDEIRRRVERAACDV